MHIDIRVMRLECVKPRQQPLRGKGGRNADGQQARLAQGVDGIHRSGEPGKAFLQVAQTRSPRIGQHKATAIAGKHRQTDVVFQKADLMAHRRRGDMQFLGGQRDAEVAGGAFKSAQGIQRGSWRLMPVRYSTKSVE